jgi:DNA-binding transcriptional ArsR family regulator
MAGIVHRVASDAQSPLDLIYATCDYTVTMTLQDTAEIEAVLRALSDPTRRRMLQLLADQPGLTTSQLARRTVGITRWGVMKHLAALRAAGLLSTLAEGRRRRHYREAAPLQALRDWLAGQL